MKVRVPPPAQRVALDWLAPAIILVIGVWNVSHNPRSASYPGAPGQHLVFLAVAVTLLGLRRRAPLIAPLAATAVVVWWSAAMWPSDAQGPFEGFVVLVGCAYSLGVLNTGRRLLVGGLAVLVGFLGGQLIILSGGGRDGDLLPLAFWLVAAFGIGYLLNRRTDQARRAREATAVLAAEQARQTARAIEDERARIARELHDVVAHGLSVIVVQAGAERRSLHHGPMDVESVDAVLSSIERAGREALVDLRRLLGLLRRTDEPAALAPQPGLDQLEELLAPVREAGVDVQLDVTGDRPELPPALDLTAYRIVQEALTNVLKHADARRVRVALAFRRTDLELDVTDDGVPRTDSQLVGVGSGHGLIGMRERVSIFGGAVSTGATPDGGWAVRARLPLPGNGSA
jgi:signal transduction histidine kinase